MGSKFKRFLAVLLTVLMLVSTVPVSALATETEHDHEHESTATTAQVVPASDHSEPEQEDTVSPASEIGLDQVCYLPGDANSDGEVHVNDAFYVLYHSLMPDDYPMNHSGDYNADGVIDKTDALLVLKYVHGLTTKPAYSHVYYAPVWNWSVDEEGVRVTVTFACSCGSSITFDSNSDFDWEMVEEQGATCTEDGFARYTASVEFEA